MPFDEMRQRQQLIARRRKKKKFSLLLSQITVPSPHYNNSTYNNSTSRMKYAALSLGPILLILWLFFGGTSQQQQSLRTQKIIDRGSVRNKYWRANVIQQSDDDSDDESDTNGVKDSNINPSKIVNSHSRPFNFIGDYNPSKPKPWPKNEKDWWTIHNKLAQKVVDSDASPPLQLNSDKEMLPQLIFYGDSITEGWGGTSFGNVPGKHRGWAVDEDKDIRRLFDTTFGKKSAWGKRALKQPLILGISGSKTYDFLWRIQDGEFPTSQMVYHGQEAESNRDSIDAVVFQLEKLERIYIVLMGTNNLGGGMLPTPTVEGMDAVGRGILQLHKDNFPNTPAAMLFSELLPRRDDFRAVKMCPPRCRNVTTLEPYKSFMPAIEKVNRALPGVVDGWREDFEDSRIVLLSSKVEEEGISDGNNSDGEEEIMEDDSSNNYTMTINCGREMFAFDDDDDFDTYMPDRLHPNAKGYEMWSHCLNKGLQVVMDHAISLTEETA